MDIFAKTKVASKFDNGNGNGNGNFGNKMEMHLKRMSYRGSIGGAHSMTLQDTHVVAGMVTTRASKKCT